MLSERRLIEPRGLWPQRHEAPSEPPHLPLQHERLGDLRAGEIWARSQSPWRPRRTSSDRALRRGVGDALSLVFSGRLLRLLRRSSRERGRRLAHLLGSGSLRQSSAVPRAAGGRRWDLRSTCKSFPVAPHLWPARQGCRRGVGEVGRVSGHPGAGRCGLRPPLRGPCPSPCGHCLPLRHGAALCPSRTRRVPLQWQRGGARVFPRWHCLRGSLPSGPLRGPGI
mmetsp:Transcript_4309/g.15121  ORF Transcript_4309/g.15121 Transcript_4309/m.15121 type:complete len:224 (+) Transcript_4309:734-1405(+)